MHRNDIKVTALLSSLLLVIFLLIADLFILVEKCEEKIYEQQETIVSISKETKELTEKSEKISIKFDKQDDINASIIENLEGMLEVLNLMRELRAKYE